MSLFSAWLKRLPWLKKYSVGNISEPIGQLIWIKKVTEFAETLPSNAPAPWDDVQSKDDLVISRVPAYLQKLITADGYCWQILEQEVLQHQMEHENCSIDCRVMNNAMSLQNEHILLSNMFRFLLVQNEINLLVTPFRILTDWNIAIPLKTVDGFPGFPEKNFPPPPTDEEKKYGL